jgi:hypothetical protein
MSALTAPTPGRPAADVLQDDGGPHREHQVVVVFDVTAADLIQAGRQIASFLKQNTTRGQTLGIESWWMPEEPLRSQVDGNDNAAMTLVPVEVAP